MEMTSPKWAQHLAAFEPHKALPILRKLAAKETNYANLVNYAVALRGCGHIIEAKEQLHQALAIDQTRPEAWSNLGQCAEDCGDFQNAPAMFQRALQCIEAAGQPAALAGEPLLAFAHSMMRLGHFSDTWPVWEAARYGKSWHPFPSLPRWTGENAARLLVVPEGGFGDGFNFLRWIPALGVESVTVLVWDSMFEFVRHELSQWSGSGCGWEIAVLPLSHKFQYSELAQFTHCAPYLSLPCYSMKTWGDIPPSLNWQPRHRIIAPPNDWIGFCWRAEENGVMRKTRTLDGHAAGKVGKYLSTRCERVVGLCPRGKELHREGDAKVPKGVIQDDGMLADWEDTARTLLKCKLVVTVDTAIAHLAGSLGVPTLILVPLRSDWKWSLPPATSTAWYGSHVKLYRNDHPLTWNTENITKAIDLMPS